MIVICQVNLDLLSMVVDGLSLLHQSPQVLNVGLKEHLAMEWFGLSYLGKRHHKVEEKPDVHHFYIRCFGKCIGDTDEPAHPKYH